MLQQVLHLNGHVVREPGMLAVERFHDLHRVTDPVEEVGIAEGDVLRAGRDLAADIFQHHLALDDAKRAVVHRHDGTVTAQVLAAPAGLGVAHDAGAVVGQGEMCVLFQRRQVVAIGHQEILTSERDLGLNLRQPRAGRAGLQAAGQAQQPLLKLSPQDRADAQTTQQAGIERGVQSKSAQMGGRG